MALLELDIPWESQPTEAVGADEGHQLSRGLLWLAAPRNSRALSSLIAETDTGTISRKPKWFGKYGNSGGIAWGIDAASSSVNLGSAAQTTTGSITVLVLALHTATGRGDYITRWANGGTSAAADQFNLLTGLTASKPQFFVSTGAVTANSGASSIAITQTQPHVIVGSYGAGGNVKVYVDGALGASTAGGGLLMSLTCTQNLRVGDSNTAGTSISGWVGLEAMWDRQLSDGEVAAVSRDPWQLFEPQRIYIPVAAGGGGTNVTADGVTVRAAARFTGGGATAVQNATAAGATLRAAARFTGGGASAVQNATADGATLRAAARFTGGGASVGGGIIVDGATVRAAARFIGGGASAVSNITASGATLRAAARFRGGGASTPVAGSGFYANRFIGLTMGLRV